MFQLHLVFFRENYQTYNKAVQRFRDGLAVVSIYFVVSITWMFTVGVKILNSWKCWKYAPISRLQTRHLICKETGPIYFSQRLLGLLPEINIPESIAGHISSPVLFRFYGENF